MEELNLVGLVELDRKHLGGIAGGTIAPTRDTSFWYDLAYGVGYVAGIIFGGGSDSSFAYAKTGLR